jgi:hypothetical protein
MFFGAFLMERLTLPSDVNVFSIDPPELWEGAFIYPA